MIKWRGESRSAGCVYILAMQVSVPEDTSGGLHVIPVRAEPARMHVSA